MENSIAPDYGVVSAYKYDATMANKIEAKWQAYWEENQTFVTHNPESASNSCPATTSADSAEPFFVLDMFPYPSGAGLHVGHPLGYIATDVYARFQRMNGKKVLHALGYDAFGLPAEQYAISTGQHPRITTLENIENMNRQLRLLGLAHDPSRTFATIDEDYVRITQWIFSKIYDAYYDVDAINPSGSKGAARPITELIAKFKENGTPDGKKWADLNAKEQSDLLNDYRLAYISYSPVNWCPGLGTVLANEEVTAEGKSERGNYPVFQRNLKQWSMRITAYSERLVADLDLLDWPDKIKAMQRNWIGKSTGAYIDFAVKRKDNSADNGANIEKLTVFTTRPDTLRGATFMCVAPEHPLVAYALENCQDSKQKAEIEEYVVSSTAKSAVQRAEDAGKKTGVRLGLSGVNPINGKELPIFVADYILMGYGTGAIMAVPADDERDEQFAKTYDVEIDYDYEKFATISDAVSEIEGLGAGKGATTYRLRDWLFSRQRYWGEPFPIVYDDDGVPYLLEDSRLPVSLPQVPDYQPKTYDPYDADSEPEPPLGRNEEWKNITLDLGDSKGERRFTRETNTMPNWAGSCWYYLRYLNSDKSCSPVDSELDKFWLGPNHNKLSGKVGGVDLYVGGVEHAVLHLLYARFWHKVLFDLGYVSAIEPFRKLFNQGYVMAPAYTDKRGQYVPAIEITRKTGAKTDENGKKVDQFFYEHDGINEEVFEEYGKMGKSLKNVITPDDMARVYGADTFRIYEMSMGPLDINRPWETRAVVGAQRYLQRLWRLVVDEHTGELVANGEHITPETEKMMHKTIDAVMVEMENLRPNTAIAKLIEYVNHLTKEFGETGTVSIQAVQTAVLLTAPLAPHIAEELWERLGSTSSITYAQIPAVDKSLLIDDTITIGVQINGKVRAELTISPNASKDEFERSALELPRIKELMEGKTVRKSIVVPGKIVNFVIG